MSEHALETLAAKLNALELTEDEEAVLSVIITGRAQEPEVTGFADGPTARLRGFNIGMPPTLLGGQDGEELVKGPIVSDYSVWIGGS
jgi:hypothetical protein